MKVTIGGKIFEVSKNEEGGYPEETTIELIDISDWVDRNVKEAFECCETRYLANQEELSTTKFKLMDLVKEVVSLHPKVQFVTNGVGKDLHLQTNKFMLKSALEVLPVVVRTWCG